MKKQVFAVALVVSAGLLAGCAQHYDSTSTQSTNMSASEQSSDMSMMKMNIKNGMNWFGGEPYMGEPALKATAALVRAGGGAEDFSFAQALVAMLGQKTVNAEVAKLTEQYGKRDVQNFLHGMTFDVTYGLKLATERGITLPQASTNLKGVKLAKALVRAGTAEDGTFWAGRLFDVAISHPLHVAVMAAVEKKENGHYLDKNTHKILNQAMYDVAQALGMNNVKLASLH